MAGSLVLKCLQGVLNLSNKLSVVYYSDELNAISELSGMPLGRVVMMQLVYEASALCTSVVVPRDGEGCAAHIRTMDSEMDFLRKLTVEVEFRRGGHTLAVASTWAGYVGVLTGVAVRPQQARDGFAVSVNMRSDNSGTFATNLRCALTGSWPIGFAVRESLFNCGNYSECAHWLSTCKLISPCYIIISGAGTWNGVIVTRGRGVGIKPLELGQPSASCTTAFDTKKAGGTAEGQTAVSSLVQPNMDHWCDEAEEMDLDSVDRRCLASRLLCKLRKDSERDGVPVSDGSLWAAMSTSPIISEITIYGTLMDPSSGTLETRLPHKVGRKLIF
eukprot:GILJ01027838.1.p1 GENE.GILJ01027838.1~~GILJ01027838.1.p1  ORF type:complete len:370 (-),score=23.06 GILJ01027838.1:423-1415(-)